MDNEIWKTYPKFTFIQGSDLGRVRTIDRYVPDGKDGKRFIIGRVLKQRRNRNGYMQVTTTINGKTITISVHRVIASSFLPNPDNLPQVNHKDCNRTNNAVNNLEWCSVSYNCQYRNKYGISYSEVAKKCPIIAINLETLEVLRFSSQTEAGKVLRINYHNIGRVISGKAKQAGGYYFMNDDGSDINISKDRLRKITAGRRLDYSIFGVSLDTQVVYLFSSKSEAGRAVGIDQSTISKVIKGQRSKTKGFWFTNADDSAVNNANNRLRKLIGNKIDNLTASDDSKKIVRFIAELKTA